MSIFKKLSVENGVAVVRDASTSKALASSTLQKPVTIRSWRNTLRKLTNDGEDLHRILFDLASGTPTTYKLPDGRESEPVIPSPEVRRAAAVDLLHMLHGKPVAQTEVDRAEADREIRQQYAAIDDDTLLAAVRKTYAFDTASAKRKALSEESNSGEDSDE